MDQIIETILHSSLPIPCELYGLTFHYYPQNYISTHLSIEMAGYTSQQIQDIMNVLQYLLPFRFPDQDYIPW
jgi:hypothetical protein